MIEQFDPSARSIVIPAVVGGPRLEHKFHFILDLGATLTCIRPDLLRVLGYDLSRPIGRKRIRSATGSVVAPIYRVTSLASLGQVQADFSVAAQDLPLTVEADGLLGLDFFRGLVLHLDFARGRIALRSPHPPWQFWR